MKHAIEFVDVAGTVYTADMLIRARARLRKVGGAWYISMQEGNERAVSCRWSWVLRPWNEPQHAMTADYDAALSIPIDLAYERIAAAAAAARARHCAYCDGRADGADRWFMNACTCGKSVT